MNDRKRAWQLLHSEIRYRADDGASTETHNENFGHILRDADSLVNVIIELAGFGATFALMHREPESAMKLADILGAKIMQEPDDEDDED